LTDMLLGALLPFAPRVAPGPAAEAISHDGRLLGICVAATVLLVMASVAATGAVRTLGGLVRERRTLHIARNLTPEKIIGYRSPARVEETPGLISRRIVERSEQIRRALAAGPSEIEMAMCAVGYSACADDLLALIQRVGERLPKSDPISRLRMRTAVRRAADSLARTRKAFPPHVRPAPPCRG
jgi:hypothetical protein